MNEQITIKEILILLLLTAVIILSLKTCSQPGEIEPSIEYVYKDTGSHHIHLDNIPVPYKVVQIDSFKFEKLIHDTINRASLDSIIEYAVEDYFAHRYYRDSLNDSNINVVVNYAVNENKATNMAISYKWKKPTTIINHLECPKNKNSLWFSNSITFYQKFYVGAELGLNIKNRSMYSVGANLPLNGNQKLFYAKYGFKIF